MRPGSWMRADRLWRWEFIAVNFNELSVRAEASIARLKI